MSHWQTGVLHIPEQDQHCSPEAQVAIYKALDGRAEMHSYPGAGHAFNRADGPNFHAEATKISHVRTKKFLKQHLENA